VDWRKRFLYALIVMLTALPLITGPLSAYAWNKKGEAQRAVETAEKARLLAEQRQHEAESERKKALIAAESERNAEELAEKRQATAERERKRAEQLAIAERKASLEAERQRKIARSRELAAYSKSYIKGDPDLSFQLAARAIKIAETDQALDALREVLPQSFLHAQLQGHTDYVYSAAFSPYGKRIVTASFDNTARVWEAAT